MKLNIALLPGDGIGPEIVEQAMKTVKAVAEKFNHELSYEHGITGAAAIDKVGDPYPAETHELCMKADANLTIIPKRLFARNRDCWPCAKNLDCTPTFARWKPLNRCSTNHHFAVNWLKAPILSASGNLQAVYILAKEVEKIMEIQRLIQIPTRVKKLNAF